MKLAASVFLGILFITILIFLLNQIQFNPDYLPYKERYFFDGNFFIDKSCNLFSCSFFHTVLLRILSLIFDFETFRYLILFLAISYLYRLKIYYKNNNLFNILLLLIILNVFYYEYFIIRHRAGISILLYWVSLQLLFVNKRYYLGSLFICLAFLIHSTTILILFYFTLLIFILDKKKIIFSIFIAILANLIFLIIYEKIGEMKSPHLFSQLNPYRLLINYFFPIFISFSYMFWSYFKKEFDSSFMKNDIFILSFLFLVNSLYFVGFFQVTGEFLVRLTSVLSGYCLWYVINSNKSYKVFSVYFTLPFFNSLFFVNSIFGNYLRSFF